MNYYDLDISVDVLSRPHKATKEELDPKEIWCNSYSRS